MEQELFTLSAFIQRLEQLAARDFSVQETHQFLKRSPLAPGELKPYIFFDPCQYTRNLLYKSGEFELLAICWQPGQKAPIHGHEGEKCWSRVEEGSLYFTNYCERSSLDGSFRLEITSPPTRGGPGYLDGPADIHAVENPFQEPAVTLHLYSRPYAECDIYDPVNGQKERRKLTYYSVFGELTEAPKSGTV